jgi:hypothetical protein
LALKILIIYSVYKELNKIKEHMPYKQGGGGDLYNFYSGNCSLKKQSLGFLLL